MEKLNKAIFFDRDGILVDLVDGQAPKTLSDFKLINKSLLVVKELQKLGYLTFIVSNQPDIALGLINEKTKNKLEDKFKKLLLKEKVKFSKIYYCYHHPLGTSKKYTLACECKKPKPGLLERAITDYKIDVQNSYIIGDRASDIKAGKRAGVKTVLFDPNNLQEKFLWSLKVQPNFRIGSLPEILKIIKPPKRAIILAAGKGERMMPLTAKTPKPLLAINNKPMIKYVIDLLSKHSFSEIGVNLFYKGKKIEHYLKKNMNPSLNFTFVYEKNLSGTAGGMKKVAEKMKLSQPFLVISSDMMVNFDLSKVYNFHLSHQGLATICCYYRKKDELKKSGLIIFDKKTKEILNFLERPKNSKEMISQWVSSSIYVFNPEILNFIPKSLNRSKIIDLPRDIFPLLLKKRQLFAFPINRNKYYQLGIDTPDRIRTAETDIKSKKFIPALPS